MNKYYWLYRLSEPLTAQGYPHIIMLYSNREVMEAVRLLEEVESASHIHPHKDAEEIGEYHVFIHKFLDPETAWIIIDDAIQAFIKQRKNDAIWENALPDDLAE